MSHTNPSVPGVSILLIVGIAALTTFGKSSLGADFVWLISDMTNALMAIPNLIALVALSTLTVKITKNYFDRKNGKDVEPMLSAYPELNKELTEQFEKENEKKNEKEESKVL